MHTTNANVRTSYGPRVDTHRCDIGAGFKRLPAAERIAAPHEIELQYLVPNELGSTLKKGHTPVQLTTLYFPQTYDVTQSLVRELGLFKAYKNTEELSQVRLRESVFTSGKNSYQLEFKGKKEESSAGSITRLEIAVPIHRRVFQKLQSQATAGAIVKLRYAIPGFIFVGDNERIATTLQLDKILQAGKPLAKLEKPLYRADIEIPFACLADEIREGKTSFSEILRQCVELSALEREVSREFSYSKLARRGYSEQLQQRSHELLTK